MLFVIGIMQSTRPPRAMFIRVSATLIGLPEFARTLLDLATGARFDADTLRLLESTASGTPPAVWG